MRIDPRRLVVLRAVADAGGVLAAASVLHLTPSAVSQHIARLEAETGVTLLDRSRLGGRRAAGLTAAGRLLARHAARVAEALAAAEHDLAGLTGQVAGPVVVGAFPTAVRHIVAPAAVALAATAPAVTVHMRQIEPGPGRAALRAGGLDLLVTETDSGADAGADLRGLAATRLFDDPYRIVVPVGWGPVAGVDALVGRPWVDGPPGSASRRVLDRVAADRGVVLDRPHECLEFPAVLAIVAAGLAAGIVPALALPADVPGVRILDGPPVGARRLDLVHRRGRHEPGAAALLVSGAILSRRP
ncbi:LysR family transcriptional regulator [Virgisporangium ochraceum]|uniref:LysR family transcriptional regulator n=1 Tax=Virgisporangium ochraceum TaxID=65505 RepID=A0A8J4EEV3_9ACTN|nr:LysR family transcriptional regulator [Virgisporangium ochraceum]GIJ72159.1 LysR family transcriptional regulator [Virgisporangium ochraceum]